MRVRSRQRGLVVVLVVMLLVPAVGGAAPPRGSPDTSLFGQLAAKVAAAAGGSADGGLAAAAAAPGLVLPLAAPAAEAPAVAPAGQQVLVEPASGPRGAVVTLSVAGAAPGARLRPMLGSIPLGAELVTDGAGAATAQVTIPDHAPIGTLVLGVAAPPGPAAAGAAAPGAAQALFTVTGPQLAGAGAADPALFAPVGAPAAPDLPGVPPAPLPAALEADPVAAQPAKPWTLAVYMTADDSQANDSTNDLEELLSATGDAAVRANAHVVVLVDRRQGPTTYWSVQGGSAPVDVTPASIRGQNVDTGSPQAFVDFMAFVAQNFPAGRYAVSLWSHGAGWEGIQFDETSGNSWDMAELRDALSRGLQQLGRPRYDLLMFDACYMGGFEVLAEIRETTSVVVAAPGLMPKQGLPYNRVLALLAQPDLAPTAIAGGIVAGVEAVYQTGSTYAVSAYALGAPFDRLTQTLDRATVELLRIAARQGGDIIQTARVNSTNYFNRFVDIGDFAAKMRASAGLGSPSVQRVADEVIAALDPGAGLVIASAFSPTSQRSYGLTAYFPEDSRGRSVGIRRVLAGSPTIDDRYGQLRIRDSGWYRLLSALATGRFPDLPPPAQEPGGQVPPPAAAAPSHDIIFAQVLNPLQVNLVRTPSDRSDGPLALLNDGYINFYPRWSPDGSKVLYISDRGVPRVNGASIGRNLFVINSDGSSARGEPTPLTDVGVNCAGGPLRGTPCTVQQVGHPAWFSDGSGVLYTLYTFDYARLPVAVRSTIRMVAPDGTRDVELLPFLAGNNPISNAIRYDTPDLRVAGNQLQHLLVSYSVAPEDASRLNFDRNFAVNNIGVYDFTDRDGVAGPGLSDLWGLILHSAADVQAGNWLHAGLPAWRPGTNEVAFLYNRIGTPPILYSPTQIDYRRPLPPGVPDRLNPLYPYLGGITFPTFDIGRLTLLPGPTRGSGFRYQMNYPYWQYRDSWLGVGSNYRPSWKPDGSNNLTLSVSTSFGYSWDAAVVASDSDADTSEDTLDFLTQNGVSVTPSWGKVRPEDVRQRLEVSPSYLAPGPNAVLILSGSGFAAGDLVTLKANGQPIGQVRADGQGRFVARVALRSAPPGLLRFSAESAPGVVAGELAAARASNAVELAVLQGGDVFLPLSRR